MRSSPPQSTVLLRSINMLKFTWPANTKLRQQAVQLEKLGKNYKLCILQLTVQVDKVPEEYSCLLRHMYKPGGHLGIRTS